MQCFRLKGGWSEVGTEQTQGRADNREQIDFGIEAPQFPSQLAGPEYLHLWGPK